MRDEAPQVQEQELRLSVSDKEILQKKDFAQMSAAEIAEVTRAIANMKLPQAELRTRRYQPDAKGLRLDMRRTLRSSLRTGGEIIDIRKLGRIDKPAPIVALLGYLGLDERIYPPVPAFPPCHHRRPQARLGVPVRHAADQCDARRCGRAIRTKRWRAVRPRWRIGPAAPASPPRCTPSTNCGAGACSGRAPSCS